MEAREKYGDKAFRVGIGAEAIQEMLKRINVEEEHKLQTEIVNNSSGQKKIKAIKRLEILDAFYRSDNKPECMILTVLPVLPPDLRPMVELGCGRCAVSDIF